MKAGPIVVIGPALFDLAARQEFDRISEAGISSARRQR